MICRQMNNKCKKLLGKLVNNLQKILKGMWKRNKKRNKKKCKIRNRYFGMNIIVFNVKIIVMNDRMHNIIE